MANQVIIRIFQSRHEHRDSELQDGNSMAVTSDHQKEWAKTGGLWNTSWNNSNVVIHKMVVLIPVSIISNDKLLVHKIIAAFEIIPTSFFHMNDLQKYNSWRSSEKAIETGTYDGNAMTYHIWWWYSCMCLFDESGSGHSYPLWWKYHEIPWVSDTSCSVASRHVHEVVTKRNHRKSQTDLLFWIRIRRW